MAPTGPCRIGPSTASNVRKRTPADVAMRAPTYGGTTSVSCVLCLDPLAHASPRNTAPCPDRIVSHDRVICRRPVSRDFFPLLGVLDFLFCLGISCVGRAWCVFRLPPRSRVEVRSYGVPAHRGPHFCASYRLTFYIRSLHGGPGTRSGGCGGHRITYVTASRWHGTRHATGVEFSTSPTPC